MRDLDYAISILAALMVVVLSTAEIAQMLWFKVAPSPQSIVVWAVCILCCLKRSGGIQVMEKFQFTKENITTEKSRDGRLSKNERFTE